MRNGNRGIAIAVRNRDSIDWVVAGDMQQMLPFRTAAKLAVWTISEGRVREVRLVGAGSFQPIEGSEIDVPNIFETSPLATEAALGRGR
jgi:hypothetical protein